MKPQRHRTEPDDEQPEQALSTAGRSVEVAGKPMKCVWSGYPDYSRTCRSRIPASVVVKAWHREIQLKDTVEGFFYFSWRNGVWLAYGLKDGCVRGVYCPTHCSERDVREASAEGSPLTERDPSPTRTDGSVVASALAAGDSRDARAEGSTVAADDSHDARG